MELAIVGSRNFNDWDVFIKIINECLQKWGDPKTIISGGAQGADTLAKRFAQEQKIPLIEFYLIGKNSAKVLDQDVIKKLLIGPHILLLFLVVKDVGLNHL